MKGGSAGPKRRDGTAMDDARAILNRVRRLVRALRTFEKQAQARYGFGAAQMFILHVLQHEEDLTLNELADRTATDQSSVSLAVGRLVQDGYVSRTTGTDDRRQVRLSLTPKGRALVRKSPPAAQEKIMSGVQAMAPADRARLMALLDQLMAGMVPGDDSGTGMLFQDSEQKVRPRASAVRRTATRRHRR